MVLTPKLALEEHFMPPDFAERRAVCDDNAAALLGF